MAGLPLLGPHDFSYYTDKSFILDAPPLTIEPTGPGAMLRHVQRPFSIPEFAEVPDGSYSLSDYLLGNEHCIVQHSAKLTADDIEACHSYFHHIGPVNSTHFSPQNRHMYRLYHGMALAVAQRCNCDAADTPVPVHRAAT
jgi:hypothetical protein